MCWCMTSEKVRLRECPCADVHVDVNVDVDSNVDVCVSNVKRSHSKCQALS